MKIEHKENTKAEKKATKKAEKRRFKLHDRTKFSLAGQVLIVSLLAAVLTAFVSYIVLRSTADRNVSQEKKTLAQQLASDVVSSLQGYPTYEWLVKTWYEQKDTLDVEYEITDITREKAKTLSMRHPGIVLDYVTEEELKGFPEEDQKLYAEVIHNQMVSLLNLLKEVYEPTYISIILMNPDFTRGTFLINGASKAQKRGDGFYDAYILGVTADAEPEQKKSMQEAVEGGRSLAEVGDYVDSFAYVQDILDGWHIMVDVTYEVATLKDEAKTQVITEMFLFLILQVVLALALYIIIFICAVRPVEQIQKNVWLYREKKDSKAVLADLGKIRIKNELGALSADISDMVVSIDQYVAEIKDITAEKEKIAAELSVATKIQADMLPRSFPAFPDRKEFDLYATMTPAKEVGGDFYDFFFVDDDHICLVIADVSGKSVPAALFMVNSKTRIQNQAILGKSPGEILAAVNDQLCVGNESGFFVTVWLAIIELSTGKGVATNAGHEHPVLRRAGGTYESVVYRHSLAVGVMEGMNFREHEFLLHPGDRIYVYTDGVPEATNAKDELFGGARMLESLNSHKGDSLQELLPNVKKDIDLFVGEAPQFDDITMLGFDYFGPERMEKEGSSESKPEDHP